MRQLAFAARPSFRALLAAVAFLAYVAAIVWHHDAQKSAWRTEQSGSLLFAASYLFYGKPFGAIDRGLWDAFLDDVRSGKVSQENSADSFLARAAARKLPSGGTMATTEDGNGLGYAYFATAALSLFGPHTSSLVTGFVILIGISVAAFLGRFSDDRLLVIPVLFLALTLMLLTPLGTTQWWIDQSPIGGIRFFVIAGILPTLHIILEFADSTRSAPRQASYALLLLQLLLLLIAISIRMSGAYFLAAIVFAAALSMWSGRGSAPHRRAVLAKAAILVIAAAVVLLGARLTMPSAYRDAGLNSETFWHRAFIALGAHPDWPFGNLAATIDCRPEMPEGLVPGVLDRNGHCAYRSAQKKGAQEVPLYGAQYDALLRDAFVNVAQQYPGKVLETYLFYKPRLLWQALSASAKLEISRRTWPILIALAVQVAILAFLVRLPAGERSQMRAICAAFGIIAAFSLAPQLFAFSSLSTASDVICYMFAGIVLALAAGFRYLPLPRYARA